MATAVSRTKLRRTLRFTTALSGSMLLAAPLAAQTVPTGPSFPAGQTNPTVGLPTANVDGGLDLGILTNANRSVINWESFSIGSKDSVTFSNGTTSSSDRVAVLNRVVGNMGTIPQSVIDGKLTSAPNISVFLINPTGILFGPNANVNVGGLVASTLDLDPADFLDGNDEYHFTTDLDGSGGIELQSGATVDTLAGGDRIAAFIGHFVDQGGAVGGRADGTDPDYVRPDAVFVAASDVTMVARPNSPLALTLNSGTAFAANNTPLVVGGTVNGRNVYIGLATASTITDALLNVSGVVTATTASATDRGIVLVAGTSSKLLPNALDPLNPTGIKVDAGATGDARISIGNTLTALDGGASANTADVEIRARGTDPMRDTISGSGNVSADDQVLIESVAGNVNVTGAISADYDVAVRAATSIATAGISAGDDVVLSAGTTISTGALSSGSVERDPGTHPAGDGDALAQAAFPTADLTGGGYVLATAGGNIQAGAIDSDHDVAVRTDGSITTQAIDAGDDVVLRAGTSIATGAVTTGAIERTPVGNRANGVGDLLAGSALAGADLTGGGNVLADAGTDIVVTGAIGGDFDVAVRAPGSVTTANVSAGDDVVLRAGTDLSAGGIVAGGTERTVGNMPNGVGDRLALALLPGISLIGGGNVFGDAGGTISVSGAIGGDVDVALRSGGTLTTGAQNARDDIVMRGGGAVSTGALSTGNAASEDREGAGDALASAALLPGESAADPLDGNDINVGGSAVQVASARTGFGVPASVGILSDLRLTASTGTLQLGTGNVAGRTLLDKRGTTGELQVSDLSTGEAMGAGGDALLVSATHIRAGSVRAAGGSIDIRAGEQAGTVTAAPGGAIALASTPVRDGAVTGLAGASNGLAQAFGRANLSAVAATGGSGAGSGSVTVTAGGLVQLGSVRAGQDIAVTAGTASIADRDGAIDISSAVATGGALTLTAFNDDPAKVKDIRLGARSIRDGGGVETGFTTDEAALDSEAGTDVTLTTDGTRGDVIVARTLKAGNVSAGEVRITSIEDAHLASGAFRVENRRGSIDVDAAHDVTGIEPATAAQRSGTDSLAIGSLTSGSGIDLDAPGDIRIGSATSSNGDIDVDAGGSVTGLALTGGFVPEGANLRANETAGANVIVDAGGLARLGSVEASNDIDVEASAISIASASAGGTVSLAATGGSAGAAPAPVDLTSLTDQLASGYGFADLTAGDLGDARDKRITVDAGLVAQLGAVRAGGAAGAEEGSTPTSLIAVNARALSIRSAEAVNGRLELTAGHGGLYLGTGRAGTTAVLIKRDDDGNGLTAGERDRDELRVTDRLTTGIAPGAAGDLRIRTLTHARLGLLEARGGSIDVRAGADSAGTAVQDGDVTGLRVPTGDPRSSGLDGDHGRATLRAVAATGSTGSGTGSVAVQAGGLVQLGAVNAGQDILVTAGSDTIADRDGAIDISSAVATGGALELLAFNDSADAAREGDIRLGSAVSERVTAEEEGASDPGAEDSSAGTYVRIETRGTGLGNDIVVGRSLTANGPAGGGSVTLTSVADVRLGATPNRIESVNDDVAIAAAGAVTGLARSDDGAIGAAGANGGELRAGTVTGAGNIRIVGGGAPAGDSAAIAGPGNVRLRDVTSTSGNIAVDAGGSVTGLATNDPGDSIERAGHVSAGRDARVTAGGLARLTSIEADRDVDVGAGTIAVDDADAGRNLSLVATGSGLHLGIGTAGGTTLLRTAQAGAAVDPLAGPLDDPSSADVDRVDIGHGAANLVARDDGDQRDRTVRVSAGLSTPGIASLGAAQLGTVRAGTATSPVSATATPAITVTADRLSVGNAAAVDGELRLTAREGPLYLGTGSAGGQALLDKRGAGSFAGNELRVRDRLTAGTGAPAGVTIVTATDARLGTVVAQGGAIDIRAGEDITDSDIARSPGGSFTVVRRPTRDGDVTGLALAAPTAAPGLDGIRGRAVLSADASVDVRAGGLVQAGAVTAGTSINVESGSTTIADRDGAIDISSAVARGGALTLTAYNDDPAKVADVRLGTVAGPAGAVTDVAAADSDASTTATLTASGTRGDVVVGRSLRANEAVTLRSVVADIRLGADPHEVRSRNGSIMVTAGRDVTGLVAGGTGVGGGGANGGELNAGTLASVGDLSIDGRGNVRLGSATSTGGSMTVGADGSVTGQRASDPVTGAGRLFAAGDVTVTAGPGPAAQDSLARVSTIAAGTTDDGATASATGGNVAVTGDIVAVERARARQGTAAPPSGGDVTLTARRSGLHAGTVQADRRLTLTTGTAGTLASPTTGDLLSPGGATRDLLDIDHGLANLNASTSVTVTAGRASPGVAPLGAAQLGDVRAGTGVTVTADRLTVTSATATAGALQLAAREGPLFLGDGSAGTTATLTKTGADAATANPTGNELRVRGTLRAGTVAGSTGNVQIATDSDARLGTVIARNGSVDVTAARDVSGIRLAADATGRGGSLAHGGAILRTGESSASPGGLDVNVTAGELAQLDSVAAGRAINLASNSIELIGAVAAPAVAITNRPLRSNPTRLGGTGTTNDVRLANGAGVDSLHFVLRQDEMNRISANEVTIESGTQNVEMQGLALGADVGRSQLRVLTRGRVDVVGTLSAEGSPDTRTIRLGGSAGAADAQDPATLASVVAIAAEPSGGGRLLAGNANLELRGTYIGLGQAAFLGEIGLTGSGAPQSNQTINSLYIGNPNSNLYRAAAPYSDRTVLTANRLTVTYGQYALFQNTAPPLAEPSGVDIGGLSVLGTLALRSTGETAPNGFALFGRINERGGNNAALLGPEVIPLDRVNRSNTRINGCLIGSGGGCLITAVGTPPLNEFDESEANILQSAEELEDRFSPIVGTNNEALFTGISSIDEVTEPTFDCESDPDNPQCPAASPDDGAPQDDSQ